jgi:hypothetical protein
MNFTSNGDAIAWTLQPYGAAQGVKEGTLNQIRNEQQNKAHHKERFILEVAAQSRYKRPRICRPGQNVSPPCKD